MIELELLNKIIATRDMSALLRNSLMDEKKWLTHREAYQFLVKFYEEYGEVPSVSTLISHVDNFEQVDAVESADTLAQKIVERNIKTEQKEFLVTLAKDFGENNAYDINEKIAKALEKFQKMSTNKNNQGIDWTTSGLERLAEYEKRKTRTFTRRIPYPFDELNSSLGQIQPGQLVTVMGFLGRGKSWLGSLIGLIANKSGFRVVMESGEMSKSEIFFRLDTLAGGFSNRGLFSGSLDFHSEEEYTKWLKGFSEDCGKAPFIIKSQEDWHQGLTLYQIEHDIQVHKPDLMVIDQFSLIRHSSPDHSGMANSSRRLKELAGRYNVAIVLLYQANAEYEKNKEKHSKEENGVKELVAPKISNFSGTIAVPQDSDVLLTLDSSTWEDSVTKQKCGKALLFVAKSRNGGENQEYELDWRPDHGVIQTKKPTDIF